MPNTELVALRVRANRKQPVANVFEQLHVVAKAAAIILRDFRVSSIIFELFKAGFSGSNCRSMHSHRSSMGFSSRPNLYQSRTLAKRTKGGSAACASPMKDAFCSYERPIMKVSLLKIEIC